VTDGGRSVRTFRRELKPPTPRCADRSLAADGVIAVRSCAHLNGGISIAVVLSTGGCEDGSSTLKEVQHGHSVARPHHG
jgi:hypothetical protein